MTDDKLQKLMEYLKSHPVILEEVMLLLSKLGINI